MNPLALWPFVKAVFKQWKLVAIAGLSLWLVLQIGETRHWKLTAENCKLGRESDAKEVRRVRAEQKAADEAHARKVEQADSKANQEVSLDLQKQLADAQRRARDLADRLRGAGQADPGSARGENLPGPANSPGGAAGASGIPDVSPEDRLICEVNTIKAKGWQDWWERVTAIPR